MTRKPLTYAAITIIAILSLLAGSATAAEGGLQTIRVASNSNVGVLPLWVAMEKGIFQKHDIEIDYQLVANVGTLPPTLGKTNDIAFITTVAAVAATSNGIPVTEVSGAYTDTLEKPDSFVMVAKGSSINSLKELEGKTVGVLTLAGTLHYGTLEMLHEAGVDVDSIKFININGPHQAAQLAAGRVDAVETLTPFSDQIRVAGGEVIGIPFQSMADKISVIWWGSTPAWAQAHPQLVQRFRDALGEAIDYIDSHESEARDILQKYTKLPESTIDIISFPDFDTTVRPQDIPIWISNMRKYAGFEGQVDPDALTFNAK